MIKEEQQKELCHPEFISGSYNRAGGQMLKQVQHDNACPAAFTLAEVLITLAIIGIVAAMTIPTLIAKYFDKAMEAKYKKVMSSLANGYKLMMNKEGVYDVAQLSLLRCDTSNGGCFGEKHSGIFANMTSTASTLPSEYSIDGETEKSPFKWDDVPYVFSTKDGVSYGVSPDDELKTFSVFVDLNGITGPNAVGTDMRKFRLLDNAKVADVTDELKDIRICSLVNLELCDTEEKCNNMFAGLSVVPGVSPNDIIYCDHINEFGVWTRSDSLALQNNPWLFAGWDGQCKAGTSGKGWYNQYCR